MMTMTTVEVEVMMTISVQKVSKAIQNKKAARRKEKSQARMIDMYYYLL
jgi:hypothetical protein